MERNRQNRERQQMGFVGVSSASRKNREPSSSPAAPKLSFELVKQVHALLEVAGPAKHDHGNSSSLTSSAGKADGVIEELMATGLKIMTQGCLVNVCLFRTNTFVSRCAVIHG